MTTAFTCCQRELCPLKLNILYEFSGSTAKTPDRFLSRFRGGMAFWRLGELILVPRSGMGHLRELVLLVGQDSPYQRYVGPSWALSDAAAH